MLNDEDPFTYAGRHYSVTNAWNAPKPVRRPMPIEVGGTGDRMLRFIAREADGWSISGSRLPQFPERARFLKDACAEIGRPYDELRVSCWIYCAVGDDEAAEDPMAQMLGAEWGLVGSVDRAVQRAGELVAGGMRDFCVFLPEGARGRACLERLINDVKPQLT